MNIQLAEQIHIPGLIRLLYQVGKVHHDIRPDIFQPDTLKYDEVALVRLLQDDTAPVFVALEGETVTGYCFCKVKPIAESGVFVPRLEFYIDDLCVDENHRGKGIATALYRYALSQAQALGAHSLTLNVWYGNESALRFYEKMGLKPRNIMMEQTL